MQYSTLFLFSLEASRCYHMPYLKTSLFSKHFCFPRFLTRFCGEGCNPCTSAKYTCFCPPRRCVSDHGCHFAFLECFCQATYYLFFQSHFSTEHSLLNYSWPTTVAPQMPWMFIMCIYFLMCIYCLVSSVKLLVNQARTTWYSAA